jgi:type VI secretion system secreted protein VgrG
MPYTQKERMCRMSSPLGDDALLVRRLRMREAVSSSYLLELELLSERDDVAFDHIVGKSVAVSLELNNQKSRHYHGLVSRFAHSGARGRFVAYRAEVVPALWLLTRRSGCRIYQHQSVPDIAKKLFAELGVTEVRQELAKSYPPLEYCVQYRETDFNFVSRLFEDSGISYFFEHGPKADTLVLFDTPDGNAPVPGQATAIYATASGAGGTSGEISEFHVERELRPGKYSHTDFNFEQPSLSLHTTTPTSLAIAGNDRFEIYDHPGSFLLPGHGESRAKTRMEAEESASLQARGVSQCAAFTPGYRFDLRGHHRKDANESFVLTEVVHEATDSIDPEDVASYENTFVCRPHRIPLRPLCTTPKPVIYGAQTATVVGAAGQEVDVDAHARVVVQFHWDREGKRDQNSSCRVRVAQNWAGKGWGLIAHPRIGQEVLVEFLEGDPDRPIVTGRVYNGEQTQPYTSPTQTGIKTRSSPGGGGYNELSFEDKAGSEKFSLQAQKDYAALIKHDHSEDVGNDRTRSVAKDEKVSIGANQKIDVTTSRTRTVGVDESVTIGSNRTKKVGVNESSTIGSDYTQTVGGSRTRTVTGAETVTVGTQRTHTVGINETISVGVAQQVTIGAMRTVNVGGPQDTTIGMGHTLSVGGAQTVSVGKGHTVTVGAEEKVTITGGQAIDVGGDRAVTVKGKLGESVTGESTHSAKTITLEGKEEIKITNGKASITLSSGGDITIDGKLITIKGSGNIVMTGEKILQN